LYPFSAKISKNKKILFTKKMRKISGLLKNVKKKHYAILGLLFGCTAALVQLVRLKESGCFPARNTGD